MRSDQIVVCCSRVGPLQIWISKAHPRCPWIFLINITSNDCEAWLHVTFVIDLYRSQSWSGVNPWIVLAGNDSWFSFPGCNVATVACRIPWIKNVCDPLSELIGNPKKKKKKTPTFSNQVAPHAWENEVIPHGGFLAELVTRKDQQRDQISLNSPLTYSILLKTNLISLCAVTKHSQTREWCKRGDDSSWSHTNVIPPLWVPPTRSLWPQR